ncbi:hypothetical protein BDZ89DRAFT_994795 [Hymenopellis radicata]|nr:hypothetical protein BDZ89DRAFT_994795 [Hymenopellis radicata]
MPQATLDELLIRVRRELPPNIFKEYFTEVQTPGIHVQHSKKLARDLQKKHAPVHYKERAHLNTTEANILLNASIKRERKFEDGFIAAFSECFRQKKGTEATKLVIKQLARYLECIHEIGGEEAAEIDPDSLERDTFATRFTYCLVSFLRKGLKAGDKDVRYWVLVTLNEIMMHWGELDLTQYEDLGTDLRERLQDKDATIRVLAARSLCARHAGSVDDGMDEHQTKTVEKLLESLEHDTSAEVRRTIIGALPFHESTSIRDRFLRRLQDIDDGVRRQIYIALQALDSSVEISLEHQELLICTGVKERVEAVVRAAHRLIYQLFQRSRPVPPVKDEDEKVPDANTSSINDYCAFLDSLEVLSKPETASLALSSVFGSQLDKKTLKLTFDEDFWNTLTPKSVFLARVFLEYLKNHGLSQQFEDLVPTANQIACNLEERHDEEAYTEPEGVFLMTELLKLSLLLDYGDPFGTKKMDFIIRKMIEEAMFLPEEIPSLCLALLPLLMRDGRDRIRYMVPVLSNIYAPAEEDKDQDPDVSFDFNESQGSSPRKRPSQKPIEQMTAVEKQDFDKAQLVSLRLTVTMLEDVNDTIENNVDLGGLFDDLIFPNLKHDKVAVKLLAWRSLGLICLIDRQKGLNALAMIMDTEKSALNHQLKVVMLKTIFDLIVLYERDVATMDWVNGAVRALLKRLATEPEPELQALICTGLCKFFIAGIITDDEVLLQLLVSYFSADTVGNEELRQSLALFFNIYSNSSPENKGRVAEMFIGTFVDNYSTENVESKTETPPSSMINQFLLWTDPRTLRMPDNASNEEREQIEKKSESIQMEMAYTMLKALYTPTLGKEEKKALCQTLSKIHRPESYDLHEGVKLVILIDTLIRRIPLDAPSKKHLEKFKQGLVTKYGADLEGADEAQWRTYETLTELFKFLDDIFKDDDEQEEKGLADDESEDVKPAIGKRRAGTLTATSGDEDGTPVPRTRAYKKRRVSTPLTDDGPQTRTRSRTAPPRKASRKRSPSVVCISSDSDEVPVEDIPLSRPCAKARGKGRPPPKETLSQLDRAISAELSSGGVERQDDSIFGPEDTSPEEDSEDEVEELVLGMPVVRVFGCVGYICYVVFFLYFMSSYSD